MGRAFNSEQWLKEERENSFMTANERVTGKRGAGSHLSY